MLKNKNVDNLITQEGIQEKSVILKGFNNIAHLVYHKYFLRDYTLLHSFKNKHCMVNNSCETARRLCGIHF